jgi:SAM-dependent methyltransferase
MSMTSEDRNFKTFSSPDVVEVYANFSGLFPAESYAFEKFLPQGASILDIGVGCGRTTPYLAGKARLYVGVDYIETMVDICAERFPGNTFYCADATSLSRFADASFDVVVFSFNGIDLIHPHPDRLRCLSEIARVLVPNGLFIFSSHNSKLLFSWPNFNHADLARKAWKLLRAAFDTIPVGARLLSSGVFHAGAGYYLDPAHGGIECYCSTPELIERDTRSAGFELLEVVSHLPPRELPRYLVPMYYYVLAKS